MRQLIKSLLTSLVMTSMVYGYAGLPQTVLAEEKPSEPQQQTKTVVQPTVSYVYTTPPGCSLSLLARRSLQLYDRDKTDFSLSPEQAIYAETNIAKQLGDRWLNEGEKVTIDRSLIEDFARKSQALTTEQTTVWQFYAQQADFNVSYINPENSEQSAAKSSQQPGSDTVTNESQQKPNSTSATPKSSSPAWYLWLIVGAALGGMYLLMDRPRKK